MKAILISAIILIISMSGFTQNQNIPTQKTSETSFTQTISIPIFSINKVYPNPVHDVVTIEFQSQTSGNIRMTLINILGTEVKKWEPYYLKSGDQKLKLDLSFLKSGMYFLKISKSDQYHTQVIKKD